MNILVEKLPTAIEIDSREYEVNTDFRSCLRIILAFEDPELASIEKQTVLIENLYKEKPDNIQKAFEQGVKFLNGGVANEDKDEVGYRLYSFEKDANIIFAAFRQTHGIDINTASLHWFKFLALFMDLGSETLFCNVTGIRKRVADGTATKEEKKMVREMPDIFDLPQPDTRTLDEREAENKFMELIEQGKERGKS